jgi:hypothetical protein
VSREADLRLEDILERAQLVLDRTDGMSSDGFRRDRRTVDAVPYARLAAPPSTPASIGCRVARHGIDAR